MATEMESETEDGATLLPVSLRENWCVAGRTEALEDAAVFGILGMMLGLSVGRMVSSENLFNVLFAVLLFVALCALILQRRRVARRRREMAVLIRQLSMGEHDDGIGE